MEILKQESVSWIVYWTSLRKEIKFEKRKESYSLNIALGSVVTCVSFDNDVSTLE